MPVLRVFPLMLALACLLLAAPLSAGTGPSIPPTDPAAITPAPDCSKAEGWLALPDNPAQYPVDVFWVYPTVLSDNEHWVMDVRDPATRKAALRSITTQASVFEGQANLYAPMYRQMNIAALSLPEKESAGLLAAGQQDLEQALQYYLEHDNNGRPFILAAHSQGSYQLIEIAKKIWGSSPQHKRLVAAYVIGWSIMPDDLKANPALKICENADQTGCFITYNSVAPGMESQAPTLKKGTWAVNPLTWKTDGEPAPASMNEGAVFFGDNGAIDQCPHFASARIKNSGLEVVAIDPTLLYDPKSSFPKGVYHVWDYSLFHENIRQNVARRIQRFTEK